MKMTVTQWSAVQDGLDEMGEVMLRDFIEYRTYGKRWTQEVGIAFHAGDEQVIRAAYDLKRQWWEADDDGGER